MPKKPLQITGQKQVFFMIYYHLRFLGGSLLHFNGGVFDRNARKEKNKFFQYIILYNSRKKRLGKASARLTPCLSPVTARPSKSSWSRTRRFWFF